MHNLAPTVYYVYWIILIIILVLMLGYWALRPKRSATGTEGRLLAWVLVLLGGLLYAIDQLPVLHTHFDAVAGRFLAGYHEPVSHGFIKFAYKVAIAVMLLSYAFSGKKRPHK